jgi:hypothetical protein
MTRFWGKKQVVNRTYSKTTYKRIGILSFHPIKLRKSAGFPTNDEGSNLDETLGIWKEAIQ